MKRLARDVFNENLQHLVITPHPVPQVPQDQFIVARKIKQITCREMGVTEAELDGPSAKEAHWWPRWVGIGLTAHCTRMGMEQIGSTFHRKDVTVCAALRKISDELRIYPERLQDFRRVLTVVEKEVL